ncbi:MAG: hypothetical protein ACK5D5_09130 [Bacteroidota bacterium]|jgi:hypothetical protein
MNRRIFFLIFFFFTSFSFLLFSQLTPEQTLFFQKQQDTLLKMAKKLYKFKDDSLKIAFNKEYSEKWEVLLNNELSMSFSFDSMKYDVGVLISDDKKFRIINWDIPLKDNIHQHFGFIQAKHPKTKKYELYELNDISETVKNPETHSGDHTKWFGMLYYQIITCNDYYVLLGYDQQDRTMSRKIIEPLSFKSDGTPLFGKSVFNKIPKKFPKRIVIEYSSDARVNLSYFPSDKVIVFNHVGPPDAYLEGQSNFYVPDGSYDYFEYKKGNWNYFEDFDARNQKSRLDNVKKDRTKEKPVFVPK